MPDPFDQFGFIPDAPSPQVNDPASPDAFDSFGFIPEDGGVFDASNIILEDDHGKGSLANRTLDFFHEASEAFFDSRMGKPLNILGEIGKKLTDIIASVPKAKAKIAGVSIPIPGTSLVEPGKELMKFAIPTSGPQVAAELLAGGIPSIAGRAGRIGASAILGAATRIAEPDPTLEDVAQYGALGATFGIAGEALMHFIKGYGIDPKPLAKSEIQKTPDAINAAIREAFIGPKLLEYQPSAQYGEIVLKEKPKVNLDRIGRAVQGAMEHKVPIESVLDDAELAVYRSPGLKPQFDAYGNFKIPFILNEEERRLTGLAGLSSPASQEFGFSIKRPIPNDWNFEKRNLGEHGFAVTKEFKNVENLKSGDLFYHGLDVAEADEVSLRMAVSGRIPDRLKDLEEFIGRSEGLDFNVLDILSEPTPVKNPLLRNYQESLRWGIRRASAIVDEGLQSAGALGRNVARLVRSVWGTAGSTPERQIMASRLQGMADFGQELAHDVEAYGRKLVNFSEKSAEKINAFLDPEIAKIKISEQDLSLPEFKAVELIKRISNLVHDTNFSQLGMDKNAWLRNRGKYIARMYEPFDGVAELKDVIKDEASSRLSLKAFTRRQDITDWHIENAINDPFYSMTKRLKQMYRNLALKEHFNWMNTQDNLVSSVKREGWVKLSESKPYGPLAGKYVRQDAMEDIKGFFFVNSHAQAAYDLLQAYDKSTPRQVFKISKTVLNPVVQLGNALGDIQFALLNGENPYTFIKNSSRANTMLNKRDPIVREMRKAGMLGNSYRPDDIYNQGLRLKEFDQNKAIKTLQEGFEFLQASYSKVDDIAKVSAVITKMDRGLPLSMAMKETMAGFQNYRTVGALFDVGAKIPIIGNPFIKFSGDLLRILSNAAVNNPLRLMGSLVALKLAADAWSVFSGESETDRRVRETRAGFPHVPFLGIPLEWKTPWGVVNISRHIGLSGAYNPPNGPTPASELGKFSPVKPEFFDVFLKGSAEDKLRSMGIATQDPLLGPVFQAFVVDRDFRGKPIADPASSPFQRSALTPEQRRENTVKFLVRQYNLPTFNDLLDLKTVYQTGKDYYGRTKTPFQSIMRVLGYRTEEFGPEEVKAEIVKRIQSHARDVEEIRRMLKSSSKVEDPEESDKQVTYWSEALSAKIKEIEELNKLTR